METDFDKVLEKARDQGWRVDRTKKGHWRFLSPDRTQPPIYFSGTPSDHRSIRNLVAQLRRAGLDV